MKWGIDRAKNDLELHPLQHFGTSQDEQSISSSNLEVLLNNAGTRAPFTPRLLYVDFVSLLKINRRPEIFTGNTYKSLT